MPRSEKPLRTLSARRRSVELSSDAAVFAFNKAKTLEEVCRELPNANLSVCVLLCASVYLCICLFVFVYLPSCLFIYLSVYLPICLCFFWCYMWSQLCNWVNWARGPLRFGLDFVMLVETKWIFLGWRELFWYHHFLVVSLRDWALKVMGIRLESRPVAKLLHELIYKLERWFLRGWRCVFCRGCYCAKVTDAAIVWFRMDTEKATRDDFLRLVQQPAIEKMVRATNWYIMKWMNSVCVHWMTWYCCVGSGRWTTVALRWMRIFSKARSN